MSVKKETVAKKELKLSGEQFNLIKEYVNLSRKLGKIPSQRDVQRFICSDSKYCRIFGSFNSYKKAALTENPKLEELMTPVKMNALDIEDYRLGLHKDSINKANDQEIVTASTLDYISKYTENIFKNQSFKTHSPKQKSKVPTERILNLVISDLHLGSNIKKEETGVLNFGPIEESRRLAKIFKETIEYKPQYRETTKLNILFLGDIIDGQLNHDPRGGAELAEQMARAIYLLSQGLKQCGDNFVEVEVHCTTGNHGRNINRHKGLAVHGKWDSYETILYYSLKNIMSNYDNVKFFIPQTPYDVVDLFGNKALITHGDTFFNAGNPGKSVNISNIENQINKINSSIHDKKNEYKIIMTGHVHIGNITFLSNGTTLIVNGPLPPVDPFALSIGITESQPGQMLIESVPDYPVGDIRYIRVSQKDDEDTELDIIIEPWKKF